METKTSWHEAEGEGAPMSVFVAELAEPGFYPAVMMFHTLTGVNQNLQNMAGRFASEGCSSQLRQTSTTDGASG